MLDFLHRTPFFRLLLPLIVGVVISQFFQVSVWLMLGFVLVGVMMVLFSLLIKDISLQYKFRWLFGSGIFLLMMVLGVWRTATKDSESNFDFPHQKAFYKVRVDGAPLEKAKSMMCRVKVIVVDSDAHWHPIKGNAVLYFTKDSAARKLKWGDVLLVQAEMAPLQVPQNPDAFDYGGYLRRQGVGASAYVASKHWKLVNSDTSFSVLRLAGACRNQLLEVYSRSGIAGDEYAVLAALTLGYTDALQPDLKSGYSASGAMHILSVSGLHVGVVYAVFMFLLGFMNRTSHTRFLRALLVIVFLWSYAIITGLSPAVVRSALMFSFIALSAGVNRRSEIYNTIFMSAFLMLVVNPNLLFDVGFQLSYSAVLSILFFYPLLKDRYQTRGKVDKFVWDTLVVSIAAQVATVPITLYYFSQFPNYFLLTNLIVIPLSTLVIYLSISLFIFSGIPIVSTLISIALKWSVWLMNFIVVSIQHLPFSLSYWSVNGWQVALLFAFVGLLTASFFNKKYSYLMGALIVFLIVVVIDFYTMFNTLHSERLVVWSGRKGTHISVVQHDRHKMFSSDTTEARFLTSNFNLKQKLRPICYTHLNSDEQMKSFQIGGKRVVLLADQQFKYRDVQMARPLALDVLIIGNRTRIDSTSLFSAFSPTLVVIDNSISKYYAQQLMSQCHTRHVCVHWVSRDGAYLMQNFD